MTDFTVYPAIDLRGGRCVRLKQGDFGRAKEYDADPVERARDWESQGAQAIHIVDLDGAEGGRPVQLGLIHRIARAVGVPLQVGGGIRSIEDLRAVRSAGAQRVVMGTAAVEDRDLRLRAVEEAGDSLLVAVDARDGVVATHGWLRSSGFSVLDLSKELAADGVASVLYTDVARDGMDAGAALEATAAVAKIIPTVASGGVRGPEDVATLSSTPGVTGVVVGTALYEGKTTLRELISCAKAPHEIILKPDAGGAGFKPAPTFNTRGWTNGLALFVLGGLDRTPGEFGEGFVCGPSLVGVRLGDGLPGHLHRGVEGGVYLVGPGGLVLDVQHAWGRPP